MNDKKREAPPEAVPEAAPKAAKEKPAASQTAAQPAPEQSAAPGTEISCSPGLAGWLAGQGLSLAFSSYQSGQLFLAGRLGGGQVSFHQHGFGRVMVPAALY